MKENTKNTIADDIRSFVQNKLQEDVAYISCEKEHLKSEMNRLLPSLLKEHLYGNLLIGLQYVSSCRISFGSSHSVSSNFNTPLLDLDIDCIEVVIADIFREMGFEIREVSRERDTLHFTIVW